MARDREQPAREVLRTHPERSNHAQTRDARLGNTDGCDCQNSSSVAGRAVMILLTRLVSGFRRLLHAAEVESDLDEEVRAYFEQAVEKNIARGMTRGAAVRAARVEMGSVEVVKDRTRDVGWESTVETLWRDVQYAIR